MIETSKWGTRLCLVLPSWKSILRAQHFMLWTEAGNISNERKLIQCFFVELLYFECQKSGRRAEECQLRALGGTAHAHRLRTVLFPEGHYHVSGLQSWFHVSTSATQLRWRWVIEVNIFAFPHCSTVPLFHFPSIGMHHGSIVPCSIAPCVALFHLFHCPLRMHHSHDRWTHINMQWLVRTKQWVCGCKPLASFSGSLWWMKQMTWKSTKSWAGQKWLTTRRLVCYMHYEQWVYVDQSQTNIIKKHLSRFEAEPNFALGRRPSCAMVWSPSQSSMGDSRRGPSSLGSLLRTVFDPCNHLGCL